MTLVGKLTMEMDVKNMDKVNGARQMEIIMALAGKKNGRILKNGLMTKEEQLWSVLNAAVKKVSMITTSTSFLRISN